MKDANAKDTSREKQTLESLKQQIEVLATFAIQESVNINETLQVIMDLQRAILARTGMDMKDVDAMCAISRREWQINHEQRLLDRLKALKAQKSEAETNHQV